MQIYQIAGYSISLSDRHDPTNDILSQTYHITMPYQTHSCDVVYCRSDGGYRQIQADALISQDICIGVGGSDCMMIALLGKTYYAVCHAGWRGLLGGIVQQTFNRLIECGEHVADIHIVYGPHMRSCCFQVGQELVGPRGLYCSQRGGSTYADMTGYCSDVLTRHGIDFEKIYDPSVCTKCHPQHYRSYRNGDLVNQALRISRSKGDERAICQQCSEC